MEKEEKIETKADKKTLDSRVIAQAIIVMGVLIAGAILLRGSSAPAPKPSTGDTVSLESVEIAPITSIDHILGNKEASVVIVEYSDIECPFCKVFHYTMKRIIEEKGNEVAWVYRHYPVPMLHQNAFTESLATECAWEQGGNEAFWKYLDEIFERTQSNDSLDLAELPKIATTIGLNTTSFTECMESERHAEKVVASMQDGTKIGEQIFGRGLGTPTSFILKDGKIVDMIVGAQPYESVLSTISKY